MSCHMAKQLIQITTINSQQDNNMPLKKKNDRN